MSNDELSNGLPHSNPVGIPTDPIQVGSGKPGEVIRTSESTITSVSTQIGQVGAKERNLMFLITGCSGLFLSNTLALLDVVWGFYNITNHLPPVSLPDWAIGFIFSSYGSAVVVWIQYKLADFFAAKKAP